ncbi:MAG: hypothetical protein ACIAXF_05510 [Phycisphaerales bacterium JB063]
MSDITPDTRVELHDFAEQLGLSPQQVRDELAGGRLAFDVDDDGVVFTDRFAVFDWMQRRVAALAMFGVHKVAFPMYAADWTDREFIPGPFEQGIAGEVAAHAAASLAKMQEAETDA